VAREALETIERAIEDVAATIARMREFYAGREPEVPLAPTALNKLAAAGPDPHRGPGWSDIASSNRGSW